MAERESAIQASPWQVLTVEEGMGHLFSPRDGASLDCPCFRADDCVKESK